MEENRKDRGGRCLVRSDKRELGGRGGVKKVAWGWGVGKEGAMIRGEGRDGGDKGGEGV